LYSQYDLHHLRSVSFDSQEGLDFSLLHSFQTGSEVHPASYLMGAGDYFYYFN
jgi:hypothetical protein